MNALVKTICLAAALLVAIPAANAQQSDRDLKKELRKNADRESRKEAKQLKKEGWKVMPGKLPLDKQIQATKYAELDRSDKGEKLYFVGTHQAVGGNYTAATQIANDRARLELARSVCAEVGQKIEQQMANTDFGQGDIKIIDEFVSANKSIVSARLHGATPTLEIYRIGENGQYEARVALKIDAQQALRDAKAGLSAGLKEKSAKLAADLDKILPD